jgi:transcriptional regulator with XRE-family HTH domain
MSRVQMIEVDGKPVAYVVPADIWARVKEMVEDAADYERALAEDDGVRYPQAVAMAMADGVRPVRAWREYRAMTQEQLAAASGVSKPYVSQIESGKREGTVATLRKLVAALGGLRDVFQFSQLELLGQPVVLAIRTSHADHRFAASAVGTRVAAFQGCGRAGLHAHDAFARGQGADGRRAGYRAHDWPFALAANGTPAGAGLGACEARTADTGQAYGLGGRP